MSPIAFTCHPERSEGPGWVGGPKIHLSPRPPDQVPRYARNDKQREPRTTNNEQRTTNNEQRTTNNAPISAIIRGRWPDLFTSSFRSTIGISTRRRCARRR